MRAVRVCIEPCSHLHRARVPGRYVAKGKVVNITAHCWGDDGEVYLGTDQGAVYTTDDDAPTAIECKALDEGGAFLCATLMT
jgi:hypothetical protein